jgi:hypothetical protein
MFKHFHRQQVSVWCSWFGFVAYCQAILEVFMVCVALGSTVTTLYCSDSFHLICFQCQLTSQRISLSFAKEAVFSSFQKVKISSMSNYRSLSIFNTCSKIRNFFILKQAAQFLDSQFNSCQHNTIRSKPAATKLVTYLSFITALVYSVSKSDAIFWLQQSVWPSSA